MYSINYVFCSWFYFLFDKTYMINATESYSFFVKLTSMKINL